MKKQKNTVSSTENLIRRENELTNAWLSAIVEGSDDAIISKDLNSIINSWNNSAERIFGYATEEAVGQPITIIFPEDRIDEEDEIINRLKRGEQIDHFETKRKHKDGALLDISLTISPIKDVDGNIVGVSKIARDITKRKVAERKLKSINETLEKRVRERTKKLHSYQQQLRSLASQLNKAEDQERQRLASELHNKLGQLLAVAKMKAGSLLHKNLPDQLAREMEELKQVVDDALEYNQNLMSELKPPPALDKEDVTELILWTVEQVEKQGLNIKIKNEGYSKPVDKELRTTLHQSVRELLQNVLKHADTNEARVTISAEQGDVKVTVEDKGKGFDLTDDLAHGPTEYGGFGLFNIKERMDWHGGSFEIESELGKGTKATLYAPLKEKEKRSEADEVIPPSQKEEPHGKLQQKIKILLVDDHEMMRRGLRQMIEKQDDLIVVEEASDGKEAIDLARTTSPHIIIMDVNMPVMDGIEATRKIKVEMPNVHVIGLSLHESPSVNKDMRRAGASDYLTKNEAFELLIATIRAQISV